MEVAPVSRPKKSALDENTGMIFGIINKYDGRGNAFILYNYTTDSITKVPRPTIPWHDDCNGAIVACKTVFGRRIYMFGGFRFSSPTYWKYKGTYLDIDTLEWRLLSCEANTTPRDLTSAAVFQHEYIVIAGGTKFAIGTGDILDTCEIFDIEKETFSEFASLPEPKAENALVTYKNTIVAIGGVTSGSTLTKSCYIYDSDNWSEFPSLQILKGNIGAIANGTIIYAISTHTGDMELFDGDVWNVIPIIGRRLYTCPIRLYDTIGMLADAPPNIYDPATKVNTICSRIYIYDSEIGWRADKSVPQNYIRMVSF